LSKDELSELLKELISDQVFLKTYKTDISIHDWVQHFDQNFDGLIDFKEFVDGCFSTDMSFFGDQSDPTPNAINVLEIDDDDEIIIESSFGDFVFLPKYGNTSITKILSKEVIFKVEQVKRCPGFKFKHNNRYLSVNNGNDQFFIQTNENKETSIKFDDKFLSSDEFGTLSFSTVDNGKNTKWKIKKIESKHKSITEQKESEVSSQQKDLEESFMNGDYKECFKICQKNSGAIFQAYLGLLYFNGLGCSKDYSKAMKYFEESKEIPFSLTFLGDILLSGLNVEKNYDLAYHYFVQSKIGANVNNANYMIGYMFFEEQNFSQAIEYFKIASKNDHMESLHMLKKIYSDGLGIEKDLHKAHEIQEHIELIKHHQPENSTSISKKEKQIIEDTKKMEAISNVSSKNLEDIIKKMEKLEKNQIDMKVTLDEHENRLGFIENKLEEFENQIETIKETMKKQNEERKKFEENIDAIIADLEEKVKKVDAIDDIKNDLSILMQEREQIQKIKKELEYIESVPELKGFNDRVQSKLTEVFLASKVISSGSVKRKETAGEMAIQMATNMFSSVCFVVAKGGMKTVLNVS
jgi:TPR repeat protein